jgi:hypothetical protein
VLVVLELEVFPVDSLCCVCFLFQLENVLDEELLKTFVGVVDAKLLKAKNLRDQH